MIFEYIWINDTEEIHSTNASTVDRARKISEPWPATPGVCRQLREEYLAVLLPKTRFCIPLDGIPAFRDAHRWLQQLDVKLVDRVNNITILYNEAWLQAYGNDGGFEYMYGELLRDGHEQYDNDSTLHKDNGIAFEHEDEYDEHGGKIVIESGINPNAFNSMDEDDVASRRMLQTIQEWDQLMHSMKITGFTSGQITWQSRADVVNMQHDEVMEAHLAKTDHVFNDCVLRPLLKAHGFYSPSQKPTSLQQVWKDFMAKYLTDIDIKVFEKCWLQFVSTIYDKWPTQDLWFPKFLNQLKSMHSDLRDDVKGAGLIRASQEMARMGVNGKFHRLKHGLLPSQDEIDAIDALESAESSLAGFESIYAGFFNDTFVAAYGDIMGDVDAGFDGWFARRICKKSVRIALPAVGIEALEPSMGA